MNQKITPLAVLMIAVGVLIVIGGIYLYRSNQAARDVAETSRRGEEVGRMMMQSHPASGPNAPPASPGAMGHVMGAHPSP